MPDPYRLDPAPTAQPVDRRPAPEPARPLRTLLWIVLVVSIAGNSVTSFSAVPLAVSIGFGLLTAVSGITLISLYVRQR
ncbi:hypothetical protein O2W18_04500 [Modestobacter sp. VKM Ac-2983]|uniref:hypothetical protein n=1 Tax=Modestobacter sp. VKM Ac-2983 TaxID=3004137 RepID=UPI0022ABC4C2|nr:hypothetical protein [Modestobacter sp. VKM Ac-2983]MCZ2804354.1 hypothetical protein [Modestobacter sp. VKM Ac-2983]